VIPYATLETFMPSHFPKKPKQRLVSGDTPILPGRLKVVQLILQKWTDYQESLSLSNDTAADTILISVLVMKKNSQPPAAVAPVFEL
jgi:hypothetical protein